MGVVHRGSQKQNPSLRSVSDVDLMNAAQHNLHRCTESPSAERIRSSRSAYLGPTSTPSKRRSDERVEAVEQRQNIARYQVLLRSSSLGEDQRRTVEKLLDEERNKLGGLPPARSDREKAANGNGGLLTWMLGWGAFSITSSGDEKNAGRELNRQKSAYRY